MARGVYIPGLIPALWLALLAATVPSAAPAQDPSPAAVPVPAPVPVPDPTLSPLPDPARIPVPAPVPSGLPAEAPDACTGRVVASRLEGCTLERCGDPDFVHAVLETGDFGPGTVLAPGQAADSARRLERLGYFRRVEVACSPRLGGIDVAVRAEPTVRLRKVLVTGNDHFYDSQVVDRLPVQPGDALDPRETLTAEVLERVRETIRRAYRDEGFTGTEARADVVPVSSSEADLALAITEGKRQKIADIEVMLRPERPLPPAPPGVESCPAVRGLDLRRWTGLSIGDPVTDRTAGEVGRALTRALRTIGFAGVRVSLAFNPESQHLVVNATWESCYLLRFYARDREAPGRAGFVPFRDDSILEALPFGDSGVFDLTEATLGREEVRAWLENRGHLFADVVLDYRARRGPTVAPAGWAPEALPDPGGETWGPGVAGRVTYLFTRHGRVEIRAIRVRDNEALDDDRILATLETKPYDFFGAPGAVLPDQVFYDLEKVERLYREEGFQSLRFAGGGEPGGPRVRKVQTEFRRGEPYTIYTYVDGHRAFRVAQPPKTEGVYLEIGIEEGPRSRIGDVTVAGVQVLPFTEALGLVGLEPGGAYAPSRVQAAASRLVRRLSDKGYLRAEARVSCAGRDPDVTRAECVPERVTSKQVDLFFDVSEGNRAVVGQVFVDGTRRTIDDVVLRDFPRPGDPYDTAKIAAAVRQLNDLGVFSSVQVNPVGVDEKPPRDRIALVVNCREARSRFLDFAAGFETLNRDEMDLPGTVSSVLSTSIAVTDIGTSGFGRALGLQIPDILLTAEARYTDQNFLGRAKRLYLPVKYGLSATAWDRYASFTPTYLDPRFFVQGLAFRVTPFAVYDRATTSLDQILLGSEFAVSKELAPHLFGSLAYETAFVKSREAGKEPDYSPWRFENKVIPTLTYDRLDQPLNPKNGGLVQASLAYINAYGQGNFLKYEFQVKGYVSIKNLVTFGLFARYGGSLSIGTPDLPQDERFSLGGNRGVRGFSNDGISQYNRDGSLRLAQRTVDKLDADGNVVTDPEGNPVQEMVWEKVDRGGDTMLMGSLEVRFPILPALDLFGAVFYDVGALAEQPRDLHGKAFRHSAGFGIRYLIAGTVPLRLDYGFILDRRCRDVNPDGSCAAREEVGNIHFGILYTF